MRLNTLFVCTMNRWRSATAETLYRQDERLNVRSAGTSRNATHTLSVQDLEWAELIVVMEYEHKQWIVDQYRGKVQLPKIEVLEIPDLYPYMDPELVELLTSGIESLLVDV